MVISREDIDTFFKTWKNDNPKDEIFVSEKDMVLNFAYYIKHKYKDAKVKFEFPFWINFEQQFETDSKFRPDKFSYLDLLITYNHINYGFEFKYLTRKVAIPDFIFNFELKNQGAQDVLRFNFRKDIYRLERLKENDGASALKIDKGFAVLLTNDKLVYMTDDAKETLDKHYRFRDIEGRGIKGGEDVKWNTAKKEVDWVKQKQFNVKLPLRPAGYEIKWENYTNIDGMKNGEFKYCIVEV